MKVIIYRYPHPQEAGQWLYTGQARKLQRRDREHRSGSTSFGRRFRKTFPAMELPKPDVQEIEVASYLEANESETVAIFRNHTWHGQGGMNLTIPGTIDYVMMAGISGRMNVESGHMSRVGKAKGKLDTETGHIHRIRTVESITKGGRVSGGLTLVKGTGIHGLTLSARLAACSKGGSIQGPKTLEDGIGIHGLSEVERVINGRKGGRIGGRKNAESGWSSALGTAQGTKNVESGHAFRLPHLRWHVRRNVINPDCKFCQQQTQLAA